MIRNSKKVGAVSVGTAPKKSGSKPKEENGISALARGIRVLRAFRIGDHALTNSELAKRTNLPRPTISRITATLTELGCLHYLESIEAYKLGGSSIAIGQIALANFNMFQIARPMMQKLAEETGLTVAIGTLEKNRMVYMDACQGPALIAVQLKIGSRLPLFSSAMGRTYLASITPEERASLVQKYGAQDAEEREYSERAIERACVDLAKRGFCTVAGEWYPEINGLAAPIITNDGNFVLDCGGPAYVLPMNRMLDEVGPQLAETARKIAASMGN